MMIMRFFAAFLFLYFNTSYFNEVTNRYYLVKPKNVSVSGDIRVNIKDIPLRNNVIRKEFNFANFKLKKKPNTKTVLITNNTDSKTIEIENNSNNQSSRI